MTRAEKVRKYVQQFEKKDADGTVVMLATFDEANRNEIDAAIVEISAMMQTDMLQVIEITATQLDSLLLAMEEE